MKIGTIIQWASNTIPSDWLLCDGRAVSRTDYSELFTVIGTTFGTGDGSSTFNLPDLRGKVGVGRNSNDTDFDTIGETGGEKRHTLTIDEMPSHNHQTTWQYDDSNITLAGGLQITAGNARYIGTSTSNNTGGGQSHNIMQPYMVLNYIIKAKIPDTIKISELNTISAIENTDILPIVDISADETKKITVEELNKNVNTYSTDEIVIGKWIDGKPIYRKIFSGEIEHGTVLLTNISTLIKTYGNGDVGTGLIRQLPYNEFFEDNRYNLKVNLMNNNLIMEALNNSGPTSTSSNTRLVLEYTKTTD